MQRVNVNISELHLVPVIVRVLRCEAEIEFIPAPVDFTLRVTLPVKHIVTVLDRCDNLAIFDRKTNSRTSHSRHVNLTVIVVTQT